MRHLGFLLCCAVWVASTASALRLGDDVQLSDVQDSDGFFEPEWAKKLRQAFSDYSLFGVGNFKYELTNGFQAAVKITDFVIYSPVAHNQSQWRRPMIKVRELTIDLDVEMAMSTTLSRVLGMAQGAPTIINVPLIRVKGLEASLQAGNLEKFMEMIGRYMDMEGPPPPEPPPCKIKDPFNAKRLIGGTVNARDQVFHYVTKLASLPTSTDAESSAAIAYRTRQKEKLHWWVDAFNKHCDKGPNGEFDILMQVRVGAILLEGATIHNIKGHEGLEGAPFTTVKLGSLQLKNVNPTNVDVVADSTIGALGSFVASTIGKTVLEKAKR